MVKDEFGPEAVILSARSLRQRARYFERRTDVRSRGHRRERQRLRSLHRHRQHSAYHGPRSAAPQTASGRRGLFHSLNQSLRSFAGRHRPAESVVPPPVTAPEAAELLSASAGAGP